MKEATGGGGAEGAEGGLIGFQDSKRSQEPRREMLENVASRLLEAPEGG